MAQTLNREGITFFYKDSSNLTIQRAKKLSKKDRAHHNKSKNFVVDTIHVIFDVDSWGKPPKTQSKREYV